MTEQELAKLLTEREAVSASLDTNVSNSTKKMVELLGLVSTVAAKCHVDLRLIVSAPAFAEILMDIRHAHGRRYNPEKIEKFITDSSPRLSIEAFDQDDADHMAARLSKLFGDNATWQTAKVDAAFAELRLAHRADADGLRSARARCSATIDWLVGSQADRAGWVLVTDDKGPEFKDLERVVNYATFRGVLEGLASAQP